MLKTVPGSRFNITDICHPDAHRHHVVNVDKFRG